MGTENPGALVGRKPGSLHWGDGLLAAEPLPLPRLHPLMQLKQLLEGGRHSSTHAQTCRSWASLVCECVCGRRVSCHRMDARHINVPRMLFSKTGWGQDHHYGLENAPAPSAVTTAGEGLTSAVDIGQYGDFHRIKVLGHLHVNLYSVVCGIETRKCIQNSKWTTTLEFIEMKFKKRMKKTAPCLQSNQSSWLEVGGIYSSRFP